MRCHASAEFPFTGLRSGRYQGHLVAKNHFEQRKGSCSRGRRLLLWSSLDKVESRLKTGRALLNRRVRWMSVCRRVLPLRAIVLVSSAKFENNVRRVCCDLKPLFERERYSRIGLVKVDLFAAQPGEIRDHTSISGDHSATFKLPF